MLGNNISIIILDKQRTKQLGR